MDPVSIQSSSCGNENFFKSDMGPKQTKMEYDIHQYSEVSHKQIQENPNSSMCSDSERKAAVQRCLQVLQHACVCQSDVNACETYGTRCQNMKRVLDHGMKCSGMINGNCTECKQLIALCCYHGKNCSQIDCPVPFCATIKRILCQNILISVVEQQQPKPDLQANNSVNVRTIH